MTNKFIKKQNFQSELTNNPHAPRYSACRSGLNCLDLVVELDNIDYELEIYARWHDCLLIDNNQYEDLLQRRADVSARLNLISK